jgi:(p)ppGpp synthase/HD superfamily hydrolase
MLPNWAVKPTPILAIFMASAGILHPFGLGRRFALALGKINQQHMTTLERAIEIAASAHAGQLDKAGQPYILHPLKVMLRVQSLHERMAAVLHDIVEDTAVSVEMLREAGFPSEVLFAISALTKLSGETRIDAAARAAADPIARAVKLADNAENMDLSRIPNPTEKDFARLREYEQVRALLLSSG